MQTQINWIKYEGRNEGLEGGKYLMFGGCVKDGRLIQELRVAEFMKLNTSGAWLGLNNFIIEYIAPLSEIERGIEEALTKTT